MGGSDFDLPGGDEANPDWGALYSAVEDEVAADRPVFTGDVFEGVSVFKDGAERTRTVMVLHHPCAIRANGVDLNSDILVATVDRFRPLKAEEWQGHYDKMPLPMISPTHPTPSKVNRAAFFDRFYIVTPEALAAGTRIATLSQIGVNILMQRYVHHTSRVLVPTFRFQEMVSGRFEEADLIQEWCEISGGQVDADTADATKWLRTPASGGGPMRQELLDDPQYRAAVRREMRQHLRGRR